MYYVPAEAGHDGSTAGGTNCLSMGSASVPMGTQGKHDLLLRITPASSPTGGRQAPRRVPGSSLGSSHAGSSEPKQEAAARCLKPIPSGQVTMSIGSFGDTCLLYTQRGPARPSSSRTEAWGWLAGHPYRQPAAARNRRLLARNLELARSARRRGRSGLFGDNSTARAL